MNNLKKLNSNVYFILSFIVVGILVYAPTFFNGFVWDDNKFILHNVQLHQLNPTVLLDNVYTVNSIYRPVLALYFSLLYNIFQTNAFVYHFLQLLLHILGTSLIYFFLKRSVSQFSAFVLSLLFLIHPINSEAVYWISSIQSQFMTTCGIGALLLITPHKDISFRRYVLIMLLLTLTIFSNENGIVYILLVQLYALLFNRLVIKKLLFSNILLLIIYLFSRFVSNAFNYIYASFAQGTLSVGERILQIPLILKYYFVTFLFPLNIQVDQLWTIKQVSLVEIKISYIIVIVLLLLFIVNSMYISWRIKSQTSRKNSTAQPVLKHQAMKYYVFFSVWFFLSFSTYIQIIPLNITIAERWFYVTFPALIGILGITLKYINPKIKRYRNHIVIIYFVILLLFSIRTFERGADWREDVTLFSHDSEIEPNNYFIVTSLSNIYLENQNFPMAIFYLNKYNKQDHYNGNSYNSLGYAYQMLGQYDKAIEAYKYALSPKIRFSDPTTEIYPYLNLSNCYLLTNRPKDAIILLSDTILRKYQNMDMYMMRATAKASINDYHGALKDADFVYLNSNDPKVIYFYQRIKAEKEQYEKNNIL